jgi:hypothetical protein
MVEGLVLSGSLSSFWPAFLWWFGGLFACLNFGPCLLFPLNLKTKNADISPSKSQSNSFETVTNFKLHDLK